MAPLLSVILKAVFSKENVMRCYCPDNEHFEQACWFRFALDVMPLNCS